MPNINLKIKLFDFEIEFSRSEWGRVTIKAKNEDEAREIFERGDYDSNDEMIASFGGETKIEGVQKI